MGVLSFLCAALPYRSRLLSIREDTPCQWPIVLRSHSHSYEANDGGNELPKSQGAGLHLRVATLKHETSRYLRDLRASAPTSKFQGVSEWFQNLGSSLVSAPSGDTSLMGIVPAISNCHTASAMARSARHVFDRR